MKTYITTLGRVNDQATLRQVPWATLVVQDHEADAYAEAYPDNDILVLPADIRTLGPTRRYMLDVVARAGDEQKIVLLDDDLTFNYRNVPGDYHLKVATAPQMEQLWERLDEALDSYAHVGVSAREGNNRLPDTPVENGRYMRVLAYNVDLFPDGIEVGRVDGMSDFDLNLQLLRAGRPSLIFTKWAQGHRGTQQPGGCSEQRTLEGHEREVDFMVAAHPGFVKKRWQKNKTGGEFGRRAEVTVYWKKAFDSSRKTV